jgi:hypothetical protein
MTARGETVLRRFTASFSLLRLRPVQNLHFGRLFGDFAENRADFPLAPP